MNGADLHTHSNESDGTSSPGQIITEAYEAGLAAIGLTDHDTTSGWAAAIATSAPGMRFIPGMELSTTYGGHSVHVLAYLFDPTDAALTAETERIRESRRERAEAIVGRIAKDFDLTWEDVLAHSALDATIGRPHIADALIAKGYAADRAAAFAGILHPRAGYTHPHYAPDTVTGVRLISNAGGVAVLAHPGTRGPGLVIPETILGMLIEAGLFGLEVHHPEHPPAVIPVLLDIANKYGLTVTGSSDYHGTGKVNRLGEQQTDVDSLERLIKASHGSNPVTL